MSDYTDDLWMDDPDDDYFDRLDSSRCPYCGSRPVIRPSTFIYNIAYPGKVLVCANYPDCDAYVGCHVRTGKPKGTLANATLRDARRRAHAAFDRLWQSPKPAMSRSAAYEWLAKKLDIDADDCHIGMMRLPEVLKVIEAVEARFGSSIRQLSAREDFK